MNTYRGKRVVVLGGAGFVGSHLCERLLQLEVDAVIAVDNLLTGDEKNLAVAKADVRFDFLQHDICQPIPVRGPVDFVFNLASPASPADYAQHWLETMRTGSEGTLRALELAQEKRGVFLQASTSEVYGDPLVHPQAESYSGNVDPTRPRSVYDEAKRYGEALVSAFRRSRGLSTRIVRIFNTYGPRMRPNDGRVVPAFMTQALRNEPFTIFGDGLQTRSFCFVDDMVDGIVRLGASDVADPVNIGNPDERTMLEFAEAVRAAVGSSAGTVFKPLPEGDPRQRKPDITRARTLLGWEPKVSLAEGLAKTVGYFRARV